MAGDLLDAAALLEPVSADAPCGPDLDLAGDPDFLQATGRIEGMLPSSFFTQDDEGNLQPFDRTKIEIGPSLREIGKLLKDTRDLRLLTLSSRLCALNRDMAGLASQFEGAAALLTERWADVHPQADEGDFGLRMAILQTLDDAPTMALPLQYMTLLDSRRLGPINYRALMIANGEIPAAAGETSLEKSAIDRAFNEGDLDQLKATFSRIGTIRDAVDAIRIATIEGAGYENAVTFDRLSGLVVKMAGTIETVLASRDPTAVATTTDAAGPDAGAGEDAPPGVQVVFRPSGPIRDVAHAAAALAAAGGYLRAHEPSSPAEILVRQAQELVGKSFIDVMRALVPAFADEATIAIGADRAFQLSFSQLSALAEPASDDDDYSSDGEESDGDAEPPPPPPTPKATNRREAIDILRQVASFYRVAEPSSPVPLLLDRACSLAESDFLTILKDVLPQLTKRDDE